MFNYFVFNYFVFYYLVFNYFVFNYFVFNYFVFIYSVTCVSAIGDPPNVLIVSSESLIDQGVSFATFTAHLCPGAFFAALCGMCVIRLIYTRLQLRSLNDQGDRTFEKELQMWRQTMARVGSVCQQEKNVRRTLLLHMQNLIRSRRKYQSKQASRSKEIDYKSKLEQLERNYVIRDKVLLVKCCIVLFGISRHLTNQIRILGTPVFQPLS